MNDPLLGKEWRLDLVEKVLDVLDKVGLVEGDLVSIISPDSNVLARFHVPGPDLKPDGNALQLPVVELPAWNKNWSDKQISANNLSPDHYSKNICVK